VIAARIKELAAQGMTPRQIARTVNRERLAIGKGNPEPLTLKQVQSILKSYTQAKKAPTDQGRE